MTGDAERVTTAASADRVRALSRHQALGLMIQFLLGMVIYVVGLPSRARGSAHTASIMVLAAHVLVALALTVGAVLIIRATAGSPDWRRRLAHGGAAAIVAAAAAGFITLATSNGWWSYVMAVGFVGALVAYGGLLIPVTEPLQPLSPPSRPDPGARPR